MTSLEALAQLIHARRLRIGFVNGCFDMLHEGHLHLLQSAQRYCDVLFVGINDDASVRHLKGSGRPRNTLRQRILALEVTKLCDVILPFSSEEHLLELITVVRPHLLIKGSDYAQGTITGVEFVKQAGGRLLLVPRLEGYSTTQLIGKDSKRDKTQ